MNLRSLPLPNQGLLIWSHRMWLQYIIPADSWKKRLLGSLARYSAFEILSRRFDGNLYFDGQVYNLSDLISCFATTNPAPVVCAAFVNSGRNPPRAYVWLQSGDTPLFLKIGRSIEQPLFENEVKVISKIDSVKNIQVMKPVELCKYDGLVLLLSEGMSLDVHRVKQRLAPQQVLAHFILHGVNASGFFTGPVHGDLSSQNVFKLGEQLLVVDWEFAALSGPDYCDLIELGAAMLVQEPDQSPNLPSLRARLYHSVGIKLNDSTLIDALVFLADRGNINAHKTLSEFYLRKKGRM